MRLDTMATSKRHPTTKSQVHHHWWVQRTYASENWIATKVKVQMIDQPAKPTAKTKKRKSTIKKGSSSDSSPNSTPNQSSSQSSEPCEESPAPITSTQPSGRQLRSRRRLAHWKPLKLKLAFYVVKTLINHRIMHLNWRRRRHLECADAQTSLRLVCFDHPRHSEPNERKYITNQDFTS